MRPVFYKDYVLKEERYTTGITSKISGSEKREYKRPTHGIVAEKLEVTNQKAERGLVCEHLLLVEPKQAYSS